MNGLQKILVGFAVEQAKNLAIEFIKTQNTKQMRKHIIMLFDKGTDKTPWTWDDKYLDPIVEKFLTEAELDSVVIEFVDGLINLLRQSVSNALILNACIDVLVTVKQVFSEKKKMLPEVQE